MHLTAVKRMYSWRCVVVLVVHAVIVTFWSPACTADISKPSAQMIYCKKKDDVVFGTDTRDWHVLEGHFAPALDPSPSLAKVMRTATYCSQPPLKNLRAFILLYFCFIHGEADQLWAIYSNLTEFDRSPKSKSNHYILPSKNPKKFKWDFQGDGGGESQL